MNGGWFKWILILLYILDFAIAQYPAAVPPPGYGANNPVNVVPSGYGVPAPASPSAPAPIVTQPPTVAPIITQAPSTAPILTQGPTVAVLNTTIAATDKPVVTPGQIIQTVAIVATKAPEVVVTNTVKALTEPAVVVVTEEVPPLVASSTAAEAEIPIPTIAEAQQSGAPKTVQPVPTEAQGTQPPVATQAPATQPPPVVTEAPYAITQLPIVTNAPETQPPVVATEAPYVATQTPVIVTQPPPPPPPPVTEAPGTYPPALTEAPVPQPTTNTAPGVQPTAAGVPGTAPWSSVEVPAETQWTQVSSGPQTSAAPLSYNSPNPALTRIKPGEIIEEKPKTRVGVPETIPFSTPAPPVSGPSNVQPAAAGYGAPPPVQLPAGTSAPVDTPAPAGTNAAPAATDAPAPATTVGTPAQTAGPSPAVSTAGGYGLSELPVLDESTPEAPAKTESGYGKGKSTVGQTALATTESERAAVLSGTTEKPSIDIPSLSAECDVKNPTTCNRNLLEVCAFRNGSYRCECPPNHSRLQDGRCLVANECFEKKFNDCSDDAICTDTLESYVCRCKSDFTDLSPEKLKPGRVCKKDINECNDPKKYDVNCAENAKCVDTPDSYTCSCNNGFFDVSERYSLPPGRKCDKDTDPCTGDKNDCSKNATCTSNKGVYTCQCKNGYSDVSPNKHYPGRDCRRTDNESPPPSAKCDPKKENTCPAGEKCVDSNSDYMCQCQRGTIRSGDNKCIVADSCTGKTDCDISANCISRPGSYDCECKAGYTDVSKNVTKRGRKCILPESDCSSRDKNQCSVFANCHPLLNGYQCQCQSGYLDVSAYNGKQTGHVCIKEKDECSDPHMNACDENADCVKKPDGYACLCQKGFYDVSSSANLSPGRVCSLQTNCPAQPTDLIFLIDGSGSIGSNTFRTEIIRFISEFVGLFTIAPDQTRVGVIQYSDIIRKEFDLNQYPSAPALQKGITGIQYLAGLTHTGEAIEYMQKEGFTESHGARSDTKNVHRIAIVITDGRAQDNVAKPSDIIRKAGVVLFAVGVTDHIQESQLLDIAGNMSRVFIVGTYKDLNTKLRAAIQRELCPPGPPTPGLNKCPGCDPSRNYICKDGNCVCPEGFCEDPVNKVCGAQLCNPDISFVTCPFPMVCKQTPYKDHRCACPSDYSCDLSDGSCVNQTLVNLPCPEGQKRNTATQQCEGCLPPCDSNKNQYCLTDAKGVLFCGCKDRRVIDPVTQVCTINECLVPGLNTCHEFANCTDTLESYFCTCLTGYNDMSPGKEPGRLCVKIEDPCANKKNNCSVDGECISDTLGHFTCRCKEGYVDKYPPIPGRDCEKRVNECADPLLNNCSKNADCHDLQVGYSCICKQGYQDLKPYEDPGRVCVIDPCQDESKNDCWLKRCRVVDINTGQFTCEPCPPGYEDADSTRPGRNCQTKVEPCADRKRNTCDPNAFCIGIPGKPDDYTCKCRDGYLDESEDLKKPGRICLIIKNPCFDVTKNDCDTNAVCHDLHNNKYNCTCKEGFRDRSTDSSKPGRICKIVLNYCLVSQLNNCSANAHCKNLEDGYNCTCFEGYKDKSENGLFGRICTFLPDVCASASLNECDIHAKCTRIGDDKYKCECLPPYKENSTNPAFPGRHCSYDGCSNKLINTCGPNADCINGDGYINCRCKDGFIDQDELRPGAKCVPEPKCGGIKCNKTLGLQCNTTSDRCMCKPGWAQKNEFSKCVECTPINLYLWVVRRNQNIYTYTPEFGNLDNPKTKEIVKMFTEGIGKTYDVTPLANCYINSQVNQIQNPSSRNVNWNDGLWIEFTGCFDKTCAPDDYAAWRTLVDTIKRNFNYSVGGTELYINVWQLPYACYKNTCDKNANCTEITPTSYTCICFAGYIDSNLDNPGRSCTATTTQKTTTVPPCGTQICKPYAGEVCVKDRCVCVKGKARRDPNDECEEYDHLLYIPVIVTHKGASLITCSGEYSNSESKAYKELIPNYVKNIDESFKSTTIYNKIVAEGVTDVTNPSVKFTDYVDGCMINTSIAVRKGGNDKEICEQLKESIRNNNNFVGMSPLKIDEEFDICNPGRKRTTTTPTTTTSTTVPTTTPHGPFCAGIYCPEGHTCNDGTCSDCVKGQEIDPETNKCRKILDLGPKCGNTRCPKGKFCVDGQCIDCDVGFDKDPETNQCTDITKLGPKCGGKRCKFGELCIDGKCSACEKGQRMNKETKKCQEECGDGLCNPGEQCVNGKCQIVCPTGMEMNTDTKKCEIFGEECGARHCKLGEHCVNGKCQICEEGMEINPDTKKCEKLGEKCGGGYCKSGEHCVNGKCQICEEGMEMNPDTKKCEKLGEECGNIHCKPGEHCVNGKCQICEEGMEMNPDSKKCEKFGEECGNGHCKLGEHCVNGKCQVCEEGMEQNPKTKKCEKTAVICNGITCKPNQTCVDGRCQDCPEGKWMNSATSKCEDATKCNLKLWIVRKNEERINYNSSYANLESKHGADLMANMKKGIPIAYNKAGLDDSVLGVDVLEYSRAPDGEDGVMTEFNVYFKKESAPGEGECLDKLITSIIENFNYSVGGTPYYITDKPPCSYIPKQKCKTCPEGTTDQSPMTPGKNCQKNVICNGVTCKTGEFCNKGRCSPCPEGQWKGPDSTKCEDVASCDLTLWIVRKNEDKINFNTSYADPDSPHRQDLIRALKTGCPIAYAKAGIPKENVVDVDVRELSKPPENKNGIITEFTVYFKKEGAPTEGECLDKLVTSIVENFNYSVGGTPYFINDIPPCTLTPKTPCKACPEGSTDLSPMTPGKNCQKDPCAKHNCDINAVCVPLAKGGFTCKCKKSFKDNSTKAEGAGRKCIYDYCLDFPDCQASNGTCVNYKEFANCECNKTPSVFTDLRKYPPSIKRVCHGDIFCLLDVDVDYCCLQIHNCHPTATCVTLPTGGYQCKCKDVGSTVADNIACPAGVIPTAGSVKRDPKCSQCNNNGDCVLSESGSKTICQCSTWYTGETCATDIRIILAIIFAILFLLLTLCCLIYYCLKCRCFGGAAGAGASYREMSSSEASQRESITGGKDSSLYQDFAIPRPKIKEGVVGGGGSRETVTEDHSREQRSLERYLDSGNRAPSVERVAGNTVAMSDVIHHLPAGTSMAAREEDSYYSDSGSDVSSSPSMQEQYERRVITDYKKSETTKTSAAANTTAEFHVFPPTKVGDITTGASATYNETTRSSRYEDDEESTRAGSTITDSTEGTVGDSYDKTTLVKRTHQFQPAATGRGGSEKFITEVNTSSKSKELKYN